MSTPRHPRIAGIFKCHRLFLMQAGLLNKPPRRESSQKPSENDEPSPGLNPVSLILTLCSLLRIKHVEEKVIQIKRYWMRSGAWRVFLILSTFLLLYFIQKLILIFEQISEVKLFFLFWLGPFSRKTFFQNYFGSVVNVPNLNLNCW